MALTRSHHSTQSVKSSGALMSATCERVHVDVVPEGASAVPPPAAAGAGEISIVMAGEDVRGEARACLAIYGPVIQHSHSSLEEEVPSEQEFASRITACLTRFPWLLAKHSTRGIVGYAYATSYKARAAYRWTVETSVYVSDACHRQRLGFRLYSALFNLLTRLHIQSIYVCIGVPNDKSIGFHKRLGFEDAGLFRRAGFKRGRWVDSLWLQKFLPEGGEEGGAGGHPSAQEPYSEDLSRVLPEPLPITALASEEVQALIAEGQRQGEEARQTESRVEEKKEEE